MKKLLVLATAIAFGFATFAQDAPKKDAKPAATKEMKKDEKKDAAKPAKKEHKAKAAPAAAPATK